MNRITHTNIGTFRQFEILLTVYEEQSITRASERLHLTQPSISMQLKKLSDAVELPLYEHAGKSIVFTEAGLRMVDAARDLLDRLNMLDMDLSDLRGLKTGTLKLAMVSTSKYSIPHLLGPFCERYKGIDIELKVGNRAQIIERLDAAKDDFYVFSHVPEDREIESRDFLDNPLVAIAGLNHPLANKKLISLQEFCREPMIMREKGSGTRYAIEKFFNEKKINPKIRMTIESNEAIKHCVMSNLGVSILSAHSLAFGQQGEIAKLDVKNLPIESQWFLVWPPKKRLSSIALTFLRYIETEGKEILRGEPLLT